MLTTELSYPNPLCSLDFEAATLLTRKEERVKGDLIVHSDQIVNSLCRIREQEWTDYGLPGMQLMTQFNLGALVLYSIGEIDAARQLCLKAIQLCLCLSDGEPSWLVAAIQPFINLGRIAGAQGRVHEAVGMFYQIFNFVRGRSPIEHKCLSIPLNMRDLILQSDRSIVAIGVNVYISDSLRILLLNRRFEEISHFIASLTQEDYIRDQGHVAVLLEAESRALLGSGDPLSALHRLNAMKAIVGMDPNFVAAYTLISQAYRAAGSIAHAKRIIGTLEVVYQQMCDASPSLSPLPIRRMGYYLALECFALRDYSTAYRYCMDVLDRCLQLGDDVGTSRTLILATRICKDRGLADTDSCFDGCRTKLLRVAEKTRYCIERALAYYELACASCAHRALADEYIARSLTLLRSCPLAEAELYASRIISECVNSCFAYAVSTERADDRLANEATPMHDVYRELSWFHGIVCSASKS